MLFFIGTNHFIIFQITTFILKIAESLYIRYFYNMVMNTTSNSNSKQAVIGVNSTYDTVLVIEGIILNNPMMSELQDIAKLNKTTLCKMALMEFMRTPVSSRKLKQLFIAANDDNKFRSVLQGGSLD